MEKLKARLGELQGFRFRETIALPEWASWQDAEERIGAYPESPAESGTLAVGERWQGRDLYLWIARKIAVPAAWRNGKVFVRLDLGKTGGGNNGGFESLLFLNGKPYSGVDGNHKEVLLPAGLAGEEAELSIRLWSGLEGGGPKRDQEHEFKLAELSLLDEAVNSLYYTAKAILESVNQLAAEQPERQDLIRVVDRAFRLIDWSRPGSPAFYESAAAAEEQLTREWRALPADHPVVVTCIGHTHIDVAWLWKLANTREKAARSFSTVLRLMEEFPEYVFLQTQPQLYAYIKQDYPEIYEQIKARAAEGRWETGGAMWLEADCNLTSGESLVRQILYGTRFFREEFGAECRYLWLPDVFGYSWALPQILRKSGIDTFMTTKISWSQYNRMPHDTFRWRGIDGSEVLTHFITTPDANSTSWFYTYNGLTDPCSVKGIWDTYRDKEINRELLLSYGYGDGGGGVNREMLEMRRRMERMPGMPKAVTGRADDYFERLQETVANTDGYVHTWDGELYLEYHRGTYTSQAYNKKMNRKLELRYRAAEWLESLRAVSGGRWQAYPQATLNAGWQIILRNQFHDIIPGSSIHEVYEDSRKEYAEAAGFAEAVETEAGLALAGPTAVQPAFATDRKEGAVELTALNSSSFERTDLLSVSAAEANLPSEAGAWFSAAGEQLAAERTNQGWLVEVPRMAPLALAAIRFVPGAEQGGLSSQGSLFRLEGRRLATPHYEIEWNEAGQLTAVLDKRANREVLAAGQRGNVLQVFEDKPKEHEAWDIDIFYQEKMREITSLQSVECVEMGRLRAIVRFAWTYGDSWIEQDLTVYAKSRRIDFVTRVDWHEHQQLLKAAFAVDVRATEATYDIQFGNVKRPTHWNTSWDYARFESVGHQWADLSEHGYGVSLLNDCKYGYDIKDNVMRLSLIKSAIYPDPDADQGEHLFTYALLPHEGGWAEGGTVQEAWSLNDPLRWIAGATGQTGKSLVRVEQGTVWIDAVKKAEDEAALIVRLHEFAGGRFATRLVSDYPLASWQECDLMERPVEEARSGSAVDVPLRPYEIKTFKLWFA